MVKDFPANAGDVRDVGSIPGLGRFTGEGIGYLLCKNEGKDKNNLYS